MAGGRELRLTLRARNTGKTAEGATCTAAVDFPRGKDNYWTWDTLTSTIPLGIEPGHYATTVLWFPVSHAAWAKYPYGECS